MMLPISPPITQGQEDLLDGLSGGARVILEGVWGEYLKRGSFESWRIIPELDQFGIGAADLYEFLDLGREIEQKHIQPGTWDGVTRDLSILKRSGPDSVYRCMVPVERLLASEPNVPEMIIPGYAGKGDLVTLFGASKSRKSFSVIELAIQAVTGGSWLTGEFQRKMKVGYLDGELRSTWFRERIVAVAEQTGIPIEEITNLNIWTLRDYPDVASVEQFIQDRFTLEPLGLDLLIIDNLSRFYPCWEGFTENDNAAMTRVMRLYQQMADDLNTCILLVHHTAKGIHDGRSVSDMGAGAGAIGRFSDGNAAIGRMRPDDYEHGEPRWMFKCEPRNYPPISIPLVRCGVLWRPASLFGSNSGETDAESRDTAKSNTGEKINPDEAATFTKRLSDAFADHVTPGTGASINTMIGWVGGSKVWARGMVHSLIADGTLVSCGEHRGHLRYRLSGVQLDMEAGGSDLPEVS